MHKATAEATGLRYDAVHKALTCSTKPKRVRAEIKRCLERWLKQVHENEEPDIAAGYRAVPVSQTHALLPELQRRFGTREEVYRRIARKTGGRPQTIGRYFRLDGQLNSAPLIVYQTARELAEGNGHSYLTEERIRTLALELAREANAVLRRWQRAGEHRQLEFRYRELRRALIVTMKEQRSKAPVFVAPAACSACSQRGGV